MYDPSMRVLTVLELLQARERATGAELAARLEVSTRTVQRYVARLQDLGVPVEGTRGPGGAYRLRPGFRLPPMMFGAEEAFALVLGLDALDALGLGEIATATAGVRAKLERVLPAAVAERVQGARSALVLDRPRTTARADVALLSELASAVHARRRVRLTYLSGTGQESERRVEPLGLVQHDGRWLLAANCLLRNDRRLFRVDRVRSAAMLGETFEPPDRFDLRGFVHERLALAAAPWEVEVWLGIPPERAEPLLPRGFVVLSPEEGGTRLRCTATILDEIAAMLLQVGCEVVIRRPAELREAFRALAARAARIADGA